MTIFIKSKVELVDIDTQGTGEHSTADVGDSVAVDHDDDDEQDQESM